MDFVLLRRDGRPIAIECKWAWREFEPKSFRVFAASYPKTDFYIVSHDVSRPFTRKVGDVHIEFLGLSDLIRKLESVEDLLSL